MSSNPTSKHQDSNFIIAIKDFIAGSVGGVAQCLSGHPLDTLKVRLQTQPDKYKGTLDCTKKTIADEGFLGLYKGVQSPLIGLTFMNAVLFFAYGQSQTIVRGKRSPDQPLSIGEIFIAGSMTGFSVAFVESPVDLFKSQLQVNYSQYRGFVDCAKQITTKYGIRGVYQGFSAAQLRNIPANALYFSSYEYFKRLLIKPGEKPGAFTLLLAGGLAGLMYWLPIFPFDTIKSTLQTDNINPTQRKYKGLVHCASIMYKTGGIGAFYRGFVPCLLRSFPANAVCFLGYETAKKILN